MADSSIVLIEEIPSWSNCNLYRFIYEWRNIPIGWEQFFEEQRPVIAVISDHIKNEKLKIYPEIQNVLKAFYLLKPEQIKVVILGQDPYHNGAATGLAFSVGDPRYGINPSLKNIAIEVEREGFELTGGSSLECWTRQGVFLINTALTVIQGTPSSHLKQWRKFSESLFKFISDKYQVVWMLWGKQAESYYSDGLISNKSNVLITSHPSPYSYNMGFRGSGIFSSANKELKLLGKPPINWGF